MSSLLNHCCSPKNKNGLWHNPRGQAFLSIGILLAGYVIIFLLNNYVFNYINKFVLIAFEANPKTGSWYRCPNINVSPLCTNVLSIITSLVPPDWSAFPLTYVNIFMFIINLFVLCFVIIVISIFCLPFIFIIRKLEIVGALQECYQFEKFLAILIIGSSIIMLVPIVLLIAGLANGITIIIGYKFDGYQSYECEHYNITNNNFEEYIKKCPRAYCSDFRSLDGIIRCSLLGNGIVCVVTAILLLIFYLMKRSINQCCKSYATYNEELNNNQPDERQPLINAVSA